MNSLQVKKAYTISLSKKNLEDLLVLWVDLAPENLPY